jgi:hypothetical protein
MKTKKWQTIGLTKKQVKELQPLFDYAKRQRLKGDGGSILAQPKQELFFPQDSCLVCAYMPENYTKRIRAIGIKAGTLKK